jgi:hypothetical protein
MFSVRTLPITVIAILASFAGTYSQARFTDVEIRYVPAGELILENQDAELVIDDKARRINVRSKAKSLDVGFDDIERAIVEVNTHGKKAGFGASLAGWMAGGLLFGDLIATSIDKPFDQDHFVLFETKGQAPLLISIDNRSVPAALKALQAALGNKVHVPQFTEKVETIPDEKFNPPKVKVSAVPTVKMRPVPNILPGKATIVMTAPVAIFFAIKPEKKGPGILVYANDKLVTVIWAGNYTFFHLDPGEYMLAGDTPAPTGLRIKVEAGKDYYFTLTPWHKGIRMRSFITRNSKELITYEMSGALWVDWKVEAEKGE